MGLTIIAPEGTYTAPAKLTTKSITENGTYNATDDEANGYSSVTVNVPSPTGKITITENGTNINVAQYATADVAVEGGSSDLAVYKVNIVNNTSTDIRGIQAYTGVGLNANGEPTEIINVEIVVLANKNNELGVLVFLKADEPFGGISFSSSVNATCTGGVAPMEGMEGQMFIVTGDGTITIS